MSRIPHVCMMALCVLCVLGTAATTNGGIVLLSDCKNANGGNDPTGAQVKAACNGQGTCGTYDNWKFIPENAEQCEMTLNTTAGTPGQYAHAKSDVRRVNCCQITVNCEDNCKNTNSKTVEEEQVISYTAGGSYTLSTGASASIGSDLAGKAQVSVTSTWSLYASGTSTNKTKETTTSAETLSSPCCGKVEKWLSVFEQTRPASGTGTFKLTGSCYDLWRQQCFTPVTFYTVVKNVSFTGNKLSEQQTPCEVTCDPVHQNCCGSATQTPEGGCQYMVWDP